MHQRDAGNPTNKYGRQRMVNANNNNTRYRRHANKHKRTLTTSR
jgi:hypothetical protein